MTFQEVDQWWIFFVDIPTYSFFFFIISVIEIIHCRLFRIPSLLLFDWSGLCQYQFAITSFKSSLHSFLRTFFSFLNCLIPEGWLWLNPKAHGEHVVLIFWIWQSFSLFIYTLSSSSSSPSLSKLRTHNVCVHVLKLLKILSPLPMPLSELDNSTKKIWMQHFQILAPIVTKHRGLSHQQIWKVLTSPSRNNLIPQPAHCQRLSGTLSCNGQQPGSQLARKERAGGDLAVHSTPPSEREALISAGRIFRRLANRLYAPTAFSKLHKVPVGVLLILGGVLEGNELNFWENSFRSVLLLFSNFAPFLTSVVPPISPKIWHSLPFHRLRKRSLLVSCNFFDVLGIGCLLVEGWPDSVLLEFFFWLPFVSSQLKREFWLRRISTSGGKRLFFTSWTLPDRAQIWYESSSIIWPSFVKISSNSAKANTFYFGASDIRTPVRHLNTPYMIKSTAWDSEIESLTSLNPSLIELDRRKMRRRHRVTAALAPRKSCFLPCHWTPTCTRALRRWSMVYHRLLFSNDPAF